MKKFLVFCGSLLSPNGGWDNFISSHSTLHEAIHEASSYVGQAAWSHVVSLEEGEVVWDSNWKREADSLKEICLEAHCNVYAVGIDLINKQYVVYLLDHKNLTNIPKDFKGWKVVVQVTGVPSA